LSGRKKSSSIFFRGVKNPPGFFPQRKKPRWFFVAFVENAPALKKRDLSLPINDLSAKSLRTGLFDTERLHMSSEDAVGRIRPDDELIKRAAVQEIFGGISTSALYEDPELMGLKIDVTAAGKSPHMVRWIAREVHDLRAQRVARSEERAAAIRAQIEERRERRRAKQRARTAAKPSARVPDLPNPD